jgi:hypothetical protein
MQEEIWKQVIGHEGLYEVSNHGRVRSVERLVSCGTKTIFKRRFTSQIMSPGIMKGRLNVCLTNNKKRTMKYVHQLVAESFIGPRPIGKEVCHFDGNGYNNNLSNLRYDTRRENMKDCVRHGTHKSPDNTGEKHHQAILTEENVLEMRRLRKQGNLIHWIAAKFNVSRTTAGQAISGYSWSHI